MAGLREEALQAAKFLEALEETVKEERERRGLTCLAAGIETGLSGNTISNIERRRYPPRLHTTIKLCHWLANGAHE